MKYTTAMVVGVILVQSCSGPAPDFSKLNPHNLLHEDIADHKITIYQTMVRHFGNTKQVNKHYGSIEENGVGKFNDYTVTALDAIKGLGITHVWYTGVLEHALMTDYSEYGIALDDPDVVKGRAGSPYAIKDYYDVSPDLAVDVPNRMQEFDDLVRRTHDAGLKVIIDFVPNHVARTYRSDNKPNGVRDIGDDDDSNMAFSPNNDFYYIPGEPLHVPGGYDAGGSDFQSPLKDGRFDENPAKVTGNNVFSAYPSQDDWFETIKLNYGMDYQNGETKHFDPIPPLWHKMRDILLFWAGKGVDGFRCDMVEMVPVEFWEWVTDEVRAKYPDMLFIGEAYNKDLYGAFYDVGKFDYLYDKVGLYDTLKVLMRNEDWANVGSIRQVWQWEVRGYSSRMLRFLENHDEQRIASAEFVGDPWLAVPAMVLSATLSTGPVMVYAGQEVGEPGSGYAGFSGEDGRTTIFDYWGVPQHQKWMNDGQFDGGQLDESMKQLRAFYARLLNTSLQYEPIRAGHFYDMTAHNMHSSGMDRFTYAHLRFTSDQKALIMTNFGREEKEIVLYFPDDVMEVFQLDNRKLTFRDQLSDAVFESEDVRQGVNVNLPASGAFILDF